MSRRPDPIRIETARRAATIARLVSDGRSASAAAELVAEWEAVHARSAQQLGRADWEDFDRWLAARARPGSQRS
jgi:hypothetical protein